MTFNNFKPWTLMFGLILIAQTSVLKAQENSCCNEMERLKKEAVSQCSEEAKDESEFKTCFADKFRLTKNGKFTYEEKTKYMDENMKCEEDEKTEMKTLLKECINNKSMECRTKFLEMCPNFCEYEDKEKFAVCQTKENAV